MNYKVIVTEKAKKQLAKMDKTAANMIFRWISKNLTNTNNPSSHGKRLKGNLQEYWRYRIGDWRLLVTIEDDQLIILVVEVGHRKEIYRK